MLIQQILVLNKNFTYFKNILQDLKINMLIDIVVFLLILIKVYSTHSNKFLDYKFSFHYRGIT